MPHKKIVFVAAKRTAFGTFGGTLKSLSATDLGVHVAKSVLETAKVSPKQVDHVLFGNVIQSSADAAYLARHIGLRAGVPLEVPALTVNRLCGSGFEAICSGVRLIQTGEAKTVLAGGSENMSQCPYVLRGARFGYRMNHGELEDALVAGLYDSYAGLAMSGTAENLASDFGISRADCDAYALRSQQLATSAQKKGSFSDEIAPLTVKTRKAEITFAVDEHVRTDASLEALSKLRPVFKKDGVITAGNASGISDGAAAVLITLEEEAKANGWPILARWGGAATVGVDPTRMGIGPVYAIKKLLSENKLSVNEIDQFEVNEAFASQYLAVEKELELPRDKTNLNGGAIAIGHPLGASGARLTGHLVHQIASGRIKNAVASACIGGGQGQALLLVN